MEDYIITFISDTHSKHDKLSELLPGGDILICSGDISSMGYLTELENFFKWFHKINSYDYKVFIAGNHDFGFQDNPNKVKQILEKYYNIDYLQDNLLVIGEDYINSIKIWGTPWQPRFMDWAFNVDRNSDELKEKWDMIPINTDILITHGPPFGYLDKMKGNNVNIGCELLREKIDVIKPKIHCFGHIHSGRGYCFNGETHFINASSLDESYRIIQDPITIKWSKLTNELNFI